MTVQNFEELQKRIHTVEDLKSLVRTMKVLSAVTIRQYERAVAALQDYVTTVEQGLHGLLRGHRVALPKPGHHADPRIGAITFGSDRGLCGRFNEELAQFSLSDLAGLCPDPQDIVHVAVGARVAGQLQGMGVTPEAEYYVPGSVSGVVETVRQLLSKVEEWRLRRGIGRVVLYFNRHGTGMRYQPARNFLLPIDTAQFGHLLSSPWPSRSLPTYTMDDGALLAAIVRQLLFVGLYRACAESLASEHASRLVAMQTAEKNIEQNLQELSSAFHEQRQDAITAELLDVVAGYEVLAGGE